MTPKLHWSSTDHPTVPNIDACIHCGMCLPVCPTYQQTAQETSSPRGRIYLIKAVSDKRIGIESTVFQHQMGECLNCRACEAACPSGVAYGSMLEKSRVQLEHARATAPHPHAPTIQPRPRWQRILRRLIFDTLFPHMRFFRLFSATLALYQRSGIQWIARHSGILRLLRLHELEAMLPDMSQHPIIPLGQIYPAEGTHRYTVALHTGCIMSTSFAHVHHATIRILQKNGCEVILPPDQTCCGALHTHSGMLDGGRDLARRNIQAFEALGVDAIISNAAGCGSTLKEYPELLDHDAAWHSRAQKFAAKVQDVHEFLAMLIHNDTFNYADLAPLPITITYQEPCHLAHAQRITQEPRMLLHAIPDLTLREMPESSLCCGSAGVYNITQPAMAAALATRKITHALATQPEIIATANPGCALQLVNELRRQGKAVDVRYIVELLDAAYNDGEGG